MKIYLYGGGGHAKVILDILYRQNQIVAGIIDDVIAQQATEIYGIPVCLSSSVLDLAGNGKVLWIVAIGNNHVRQSIAEKLTNQGCQFAQAIHPSAQISLGVTIAPGTVVMANAVINADAQIGHHNIINTGSTIDHDCVLEDYVHIAPGCSLCGQVKVGMGALIGVGTKVKPSMHIGAWTTCGAGSVVVKSLPSNCLAYGCPAKIVSQVFHPLRTPDPS